MRSAIAAAAGVGGRRRGAAACYSSTWTCFPGVRWSVRAVRGAANRVDRVIAVSDAVAVDLDPRAAIGPQATRGTARDRFEAFSASPVPADPPTALLLGAIVGWKRPDLALEAVAIAARDLPDLRLVVAGHTVGEESERLLAT